MGAQTTWKAVDDAVSRLQRIDPVAGKVAELVLFAGFSNSHIGQLVDLSAEEVTKLWDGSRGWLEAEVRGQSSR